MLDLRAVPRLFARGHAAVLLVVTWPSRVPATWWHPGYLFQSARAVPVLARLRLRSDPQRLTPAAAARTHPRFEENARNRARRVKQSSSTAALMLRVVRTSGHTIRETLRRYPYYYTR
jgi:hypothetical protein